MPPSLDIGTIIAEQMPADLMTDVPTSVYRLWLTALGDRVGDAIDATESVRDNLFVSTADWNLPYWEQVLLLGDAGALTTAQRRTRILDAMVGYGISIGAMERRVALTTGATPFIIEWFQRIARWDEARWDEAFWSDPAWQFTFEVIVCGLRKRLATLDATETWTNAEHRTAPLVLPYSSRIISATDETKIATFTPSPALDLSRFADGTLAVDDDVLLFFAAVTDPASVASCAITLRTSLGSDTDSATHAITFAGGTFERFAFARSSFTTSGAFNWANVRQVTFTLETTAGANVVLLLDELWLVQPTPPNAYDGTDLAASINKHKPAGTLAVVTTL